MCEKENEKIRKTSCKKWQQGFRSGGVAVIVNEKSVNEVKRNQKNLIIKKTFRLQKRDTHSHARHTNELMEKKPFNEPKKQFMCVM